MSDFIVRPLEDAQLRAAATLFSATLHMQPLDDEGWERAKAGIQPERVLGAFERDAMIGTARSFDTELTVPGGSRLPMAAVTGVGVRADRTRRGVLSELMRSQVADLVDRGVAVASLRASEGAIYGRFGYGVATRARGYTARRVRAVPRADAPSGGEVELLDLEEALARLPRLYETFGRPRSGMMARPPYWWASASRFLRRGEGPVPAVVHHGVSGQDGYAIYAVTRSADGVSTMRVKEMHYANAEALAGIWRFLCSVDLVDEIEANLRPLDEPVELLMTDERAVRTTSMVDETWLRLVDVPSALAARTYGDAGSVVIEVNDRQVESNRGCYRVGGGGSERVDSAPQLSLDVDALAMVYLGDRAATTLATAGRVAVHDPEALPVADRLFATPCSPWCGTFF